jgi:hypothetical protein
MRPPTDQPSAEPADLLRREQGGMEGTPTPSTRTVSIPRRVALLSLCTVLITILILFVYVISIPEWGRICTELAVFSLGAAALTLAFPGNKQLLTVVAGIFTLVVTFPQSASIRTVTVNEAWAACPNSDTPMALVTTKDPIVTPLPNTRGQLGQTHIDSIIAPNGSSNVTKREKVCVTVQKYPDHHRALWLILRLRLPVQHPSYQLFYAVGELSDPAPGKYSISINRSCSSLTSGERHTLVIVSADATATQQLWNNYNARIHSKCIPTYDKFRHHLPSGTFIVSNQGDVIQK